VRGPAGGQPTTVRARGRHLGGQFSTSSSVARVGLVPSPHARLGSPPNLVRHVWRRRTEDTRRARRVPPVPRLGPFFNPDRVSPNCRCHPYQQVHQVRDRPGYPRSGTPLESTRACPEHVVGERRVGLLFTAAGWQTNSNHTSITGDTHEQRACHHPIPHAPQPQSLQREPRKKKNNKKNDIKHRVVGQDHLGLLPVAERQPYRARSSAPATIPVEVCDPALPCNAAVGRRS